MIAKMVGQCSRKRRHDTRAEANAALGPAHKGMVVYRCDVCDGFHVGHPPRRGKFRASAAKGGR